jgi:hypothetical protein
MVEHLPCGSEALGLIPYTAKEGREGGREERTVQSREGRTRERGEREKTFWENSFL